MVVLGAAFSPTAARDAARALAKLPDVAPSAIARAPLGAVGRVSDGKVLVAVCIAERAIDKVARIVDQYGGEIVTRATYSEQDCGVDTSPARTVGPLDLPRSAVSGRANN